MRNLHGHAQQAGMSTNLQNNIFTNLAMEEENTTTIEEENHKENTSKESQYKLEHQGKQSKEAKDGSIIRRQEQQLRYYSQKT